MIGQVQDRQCIEDVIRFAAEERLFLMADEVTLSDVTMGGDALSLSVFSTYLLFLIPPKFGMPNSQTTHKHAHIRPLPPAWENDDSLQLSPLKYCMWCCTGSLPTALTSHMHRAGVEETQSYMCIESKPLVPEWQTGDRFLAGARFYPRPCYSHALLTAAP